jgi:hypothetical protein
MSLSTTVIIIVLCLAIAVASALDTVKAREQRNSQQRSASAPESRIDSGQDTP